MCSGPVSRASRPGVQESVAGPIPAVPPTGARAVQGPAAVCGVVHRLRPLLAIEPAARPADAAERLWIVDGTLIPVRDRKAGASSRNYHFSANVQVVIDADTKLVIAAARPVPGDTADVKTWRDSGLADVCQDVTVPGDGACINTGFVIPHRKRPGRPLLPGEDPTTRSTDACGPA